MADKLDQMLRKLQADASVCQYCEKRVDKRTAK